MARVSRAMCMYVWSHPPSFLAVAQARTIEEARRAMLLEIGESGDGSCPVRDSAREWMQANNPQIWRCPNAKFCLSDSAECEELALLIETQSKQIRELKHELAEARKAMSGYIASQARERIVEFNQ